MMWDKSIVKSQLIDGALDNVGLDGCELTMHLLLPNSPVSRIHVIC